MSGPGENRGVDLSEFKRHKPVLAEEILGIIPETGALRVIDCNVGYGGHSSLILRKNGLAELIGIDRDGDAISGAEETLKFASGRFKLKRGSFGDLKDLAAGEGWASADVVLFDLGVSSPQIDDPRRGFSFRFDGPLDMRMDKRSVLTASRILNTWGLDELTDIFRRYGELRNPGRLARAIVERRGTKAWETTAEFAELCDTVVGRARKGAPPAPTLCFQALRIAVNDELGELERALEAAVDILRSGGKIAVISFHSLEDRIVKDYFRRLASECLCPPGLPVCVCGHKPSLRILTRKPIVASEEETRTNKRASSAKLRIAEKL